MPRWWKESLAALALLAMLAVCVAHLNTVDDARLYYEIAGQVLGRGFDTRFIEGKRADDATQLVARGTLPYRDFVVEYPPLALGVFVVPRLLTDDVRAYHWIYQGAMAITLIAMAGALPLLLRQVRPAIGHAHLRALVLVTLFALCTGPYILRRFDLLVAAMVLAATLSTFRGRHFLAGLFLGTAVALKLWPLLLLPVFALHDMRRRAAVPLIVGFALVPLLSHLVLVPAIGGDVLNYLRFHGGRAVQLESLASSLLMLGGKLAGSPPGVTFDHGSVNLVMPWTLVPTLFAGAIASGVALVASYMIAWRAMRRSEESDRPASFVVSLVLLITAAIATGRTLSPQYLIWLFPLALVAPQRTIAGLYLAALVVTHVFYPGIYLRYEDMEAMKWSGILVLLTRNVLLVVLAILAARAALRRRTAKALEPVAQYQVV